MDFSAGTRTQFTYDLADRLVSQKEYTGTGQNGGTLRSSTDFTYADKTNYLTNVKHFSPLGTQNIAYKYGNINNGEMPDQVYSVSWNGVEKVTNKFDSLSRLSKRTVNGLATNYTYKDLEGNQTTTLVESINTGGISYVYDYDEVNNIKSVTVGNKKTTYEYDELNQLTRVNDPFENVTHVYTYNNGNIVYDLVYEYSVGVLPSYPLSATQYLYENATWSDILTGVKKSHFDNGVEIIDDRYSISSDTIGNITNLNGSEYSWLGRQLQSVSNSDNSKTTYSYNADGQRIAKAVNSANGDEYNYRYYYNGDILAGYRLVITNADGSSTTHNVAFMYDENGEAFGFNYNGNDYYYVCNAQNDVVRIVDSANKTVVSYQYDSWGKLLSCEDTSENDIVSFINPYTYRGYYYDSDTGFYYVFSRYYDSELFRFINADGELSQIGGDILGYNLFTYCFNNPVNMNDPSGEWPKWLSGALKVVSGAAQMVAGVALGTFTSWTGIGAVVAGFLILNGAATIAQGTGQIVNNFTKSKMLREDNIVRTGVQNVGRAFGGDNGAKVAGNVYDVAVIAANIYACKISLENSMPKIIDSKVFSVNDGYGFKVGKNIEMFYRNPNAAGGLGGTIFSYKGPLGKFRIDWDPAHGFHCHPPGH